MAKNKKEKKEEKVLVRVLRESRPIDPDKPLPKRIRMLVSLATFERAYEPGHTYEVGKDLSEASARNYLKNGLAEEDTSLPGAPETK